MKDLRSACTVGLFAASLLGCGTVKSDNWAPVQAEITRDLQGQTWPLLTVDGELDPAPLWEMTRSARIVAIGEASPGVREFRKLMNVMVQQAVADGEPLVIALDLPFVDGVKLDAWVGDAWYPPDPRLKQRELTDPDAFDLDRLNFLREHTLLMAWIRKYNDAAPPERDIRIVGLDGCTDPRCVAWLAHYVGAVERPLADAAGRLTAELRNDGTLPRRSAEQTDAARKTIADLGARLHAAREQYVATAGAGAHETALRLVQLVERRFDPSLAENGPPASAETGAVMADNAVWGAERTPGARVMILANNAYTDRSPAPNMGRLLADRYGGEYVVIHTTFNRGFLFTVRDPSAMPQHQWHSGRTPGIQGGAEDVQLTGWAPPGSLEDVLKMPGDGYALDMRAATATDGELARYLRGSHRTRWYPETWRGRFGGGPWANVALASSADVLVYVSNAQVFR
jgi:erythromycin esterase-like protein